MSTKGFEDNNKSKTGADTTSEKNSLNKSDASSNLRNEFLSSLDKGGTPSIPKDSSSKNPGTSSLPGFTLYDSANPSKPGDQTKSSSADSSSKPGDLSKSPYADPSTKPGDLSKSPATDASIKPAVDTATKPGDIGKSPVDPSKTPTDAELMAKYGDAKRTDAYGEPKGIADAKYKYTGLNNGEITQYRSLDEGKDGNPGGPKGPDGKGTGWDKAVGASPAATDAETKLKDQFDKMKTANEKAGTAPTKEQLATLDSLNKDFIDTLRNDPKYKNNSDLQKELNTLQDLYAKRNRALFTKPGATSADM